MKKIMIAGESAEKFTVVGVSPSAEYVRDSLGTILGTTLAHSPDSENGVHEIRVGRTSRSCRRLKIDGIGREGYIIRCALGSIFIRANTEAGVRAGAEKFVSLCGGEDDSVFPDGYLLKKTEE